jgi:hypothetical protein
MLHEITAVHQDQPGLRRRWFQDDYFDLFVWLSAQRRLRAFQMAYSRLRRERVLEWSSERGFTHSAVDEGDTQPSFNRTPLLLHGGFCPTRQVAREFERRSVDLEALLRDAILTKLRHAVRLRRFSRGQDIRARAHAY